MAKPHLPLSEAKALYEAGYTTAEIAEKYGCVQGYVRQTLSNAGVYTSEARQLDKGKIRALWKAGWSIWKIMNECNCTEDDVKGVVHAKNLSV